MGKSDYILEVRIKDYTRTAVVFDATDLTTGREYTQCLPDWIYRYSKDYINQHTRFILPSWIRGPVGEFWIGWLEWERPIRGEVFYTPTASENNKYDSDNA